jgi:hypothetical protein
MTRKEKDYIQTWLYNEWGRAERDFLDSLGQFQRHSNNKVLFQNLLENFFKYKFYVEVLDKFIELTELSLFDDTTKYTNRSAELLNGLSLTSHQDDLIYSFVLGIIHSNRLSNFDADIKGVEYHE